jgi:hypothetical protein
MDKPVLYQITVQGRLAAHWCEWFDDMQVTVDGRGDTRLTGPVIDQAALFGLLARIRDLGLALVALRRLGLVERYSPRVKTA